MTMRTVDEKEIFDMLNKAEEISFQNWKLYRTLYDKELKKRDDRIEKLEKSLQEIAQLKYNYPDLAWDAVRTMKNIANAAFAGEKKNDTET